jgi:hypothetical protein
LVSPYLDFCAICNTSDGALFKRSKPCIIAFHVGDVWDGKAVSRRSPLGKYLAFISLAHKLSGYSIRRHAYFASKA